MQRRGIFGVPIRRVLLELRKLYHPPKTFLHFRTPLDLLIATILSAQCTDVRVNLVTRTILYPKYRTARDYLDVSRRGLERDIQTCGFYRTKAKNIQKMCQLLVTRFRGKVPQTVEELTELPGVGRKTAAIILSAAFGKNEGIACDTHVIRLSQRLGLTRHHDPKKIEIDLMRLLPRRQWGVINPLLISHGRAVCTARSRKCDLCVFQKECPSSLTMERKDLAQK
ncbi:endonuclease III [Candidatus Peribacteria bacterium RIFCSPLOWO2_12_FULL_55_15]|nr:MAG: endonuclease III [Candidatus Peribacteria bacterium RIFCSPHIGHO2_01_FULL_54_22]OGJ62215.1 MAG: endonuclease III [Candidatus Peribacteria bacterium RIFCSPHIGHO2_02_FULL_55_24]OGJ64130.1 MAG: endonuclease III [Candidatus Peribacteria bacterium RIFCSPHIGHO2_12_FULL_54_10]OGJ69055.1 MAG: endonuclease III [Candidatus Peribacteria bacterium RIFCSPLOWO2_01_FULL_54_110]OGJ69935.1 MAG: endonuclease III [Candidatus Peribacteria bacterium RIFCSPLOWO2_02_FULL_55_36]OGJ72326.1 MAG: endonuclease III